MKKIIIISICFCLSILSCAQKTQDCDCNRTTDNKYDEKRLPQDICIPCGDYKISYCYPKEDLNGDGLKDFFFLWKKNKASIGDTTYISIYFQNPDSTYTLVKTLNNLFPLFEGYDKMYHLLKIEDIPIKYQKTFERYFELYDGEYPMYLNYFSISSEGITLAMPEDAADVTIVKYRYDEQIKNWVYDKAYLHCKYPDIPDVPKDYSKYLGPTIDNFDYLFWDKMDYISK